MAVYKKTYHRYDGPLTPERTRFLVLARFAFEDLRRSRFLTLFFAATFIWPVLCALAIYLTHNLAALKLFDMDPARFVQIDANFFLFFLGFQSMLAFFMNAFVGPGLVSPDLGNNALPLYLSRPLSRAEYVLGKLAILVTLLSLMTWVPGLLLFALQAYLGGWTWLSVYWSMAIGIFLGPMIWILLLALLALAISAWVKWRPVAGALLFGVFFVAAGFGAAINEVLRTRWGHLINIGHLIGTVWVSLFEHPGRGAVFFRVARGEEIPLWSCWAMLLAICAACLWLLNRRIRGVEIVR